MVSIEYKKYLKGYIKNRKKVLDIGCVGINNLYETHTWLCENAEHVTGIDNNYEGIQVMLGWNYDVRYADAEDFYLAEEFDVIIALELLEHLGCPSKFLKCAKRHMHEDSVLIISVPNAQSLMHIIRDEESEWHLQSYNQHTIRQLLEFCGYRVVEMPLMKGYNWRTFTWNPIRMAYRIFGYILTTICPQYRNGLIIVAKKEEVG